MKAALRPASGMYQKRVQGVRGAKQSLQAILLLGALSGTAFGASALDENSNGPVSTDNVTNNGTKTTPTLEEVVVTAEKREERLQDVPVSVSAIDAAELANTNQTKLSDYFDEVPGLQLAGGIQSSQIISIRGITTGGESTSATVGITVDGVPFGFTGSLVVPDFDPGDLSRVEVLRGPQGTLYGASSMGGLINFVTQEPSTYGFSGRVEAGTDTIYNSAGLGYSVRGSVNVPLTDTLAIRVSAFDREDPGYIDNPLLSRDDVNVEHASGGHVSVFWKPVDGFSAKFSALFQQIIGGGTSDIDTQNTITGTPLSGLQQGYVAGVGPYDREVQAFSLTLSDHVGGISLQAVTGYNVNESHDSFDATPGFGGESGLSNTVFGVLGAPLNEGGRDWRLTEELRLSTSIANRADFLLGAFYSRESATSYQAIDAANPYTGAIQGQLLYLGLYGTIGVQNEIAGFTDITYHFTDDIDVHVGGRESKYEVSANGGQVFTGPYVTDLLGFQSPLYGGATPSFTNTAATYLVTPRYRITPDWMVYARVASGYRPGGLSGQTLPGIPPTYGPDKTWNYEVGTKGDFFDHRVSFDVSLYYISWKDIQLGLTQESNGSGFSYTGNGAGAKSQGAEVSARWRPIDSLKIGGWVVFSDAELTQDFPPNGTGNPAGFAGDQLPYSSRFSASLSIDDSIPITQHWSAYGGAVVSYLGDRKDTLAVCLAVSLSGACTSATPRQDLPAYAKTDLHAGVKGNSWTINMYANNVLDRRGLISGGLGNPIPYSFYIIQPRTIGISVAREF
jgi:iron complex outermembrane receptor protein